jgi:hypothetical protein
MRQPPENFPRYGYLLEQACTPVGVILTIFRELEDQSIRCNISSWYVESAYRSYASLLIAAALRHKGVTYVNISPAPHTWPVIEAQGFHRYCNGQMLTLPILSNRLDKSGVETFDAGPAQQEGLTTSEQQIMADHISRGCIGLVVREHQLTYPFLFHPRRLLSNTLPAVQLAHCRNIDDYVRFAQPIGWALTKRGKPFVIVDALEKIDGVSGIFFKDRGPKYARGPSPPRLGDLSYCENILFGA